MSKRQWGHAEIGAILVFLLIITTLITARILPASIISPHKLENGIPRMDISLRNVTLEEINAGPKETRYPGNQLALTTTDYHTTTYDNVEIKGRGNSTWYDIQGKHPYQIKFSTKTDLFNMGASKKYILLANYFDASFIRNDIALYLESLLNETYPVRGEYVELYVDDVYRGLYYLTTKVEIGSSRVHLQDPDGILVELDNLWAGKDNCYYTTIGTCLVIKDSTNESRKIIAMQSFLADFNKLELAIKNQDYDSIEELVDIDSFARYYLLNEFTVNPDSYATSFFLYKDGPADKIHAGPGWDFDLSLGNKSWVTDYLPFYSPETLHAMNYYIFQNQQYSPIIANLAKIPEFINAVKNTWQQYMSGHKDDLLNYTRNRAAYIAKAAAKDEAYREYGSFADSVEEILDWLSRRYDLFDEEYGDSHLLPTRPISI